MKKNTKKKTVAKAKKSVSWVSCIIAFVLGALFGILIYANIDSISFGDLPNCPDGTAPNANGCCAGEVYTNMGDLGYNCCPEIGGDCFPPIR
jgi:hypothetical protein